MKTSRRRFIATSIAGGLATTVPDFSCVSQKPKETEEIKAKYAILDEILKEPVLKSNLFTSPVIIETIELLRLDRSSSFICRVRSKEGAEGISVSNDLYISSLYPILLENIQRTFIGKNALDLDSLIDQVYRNNYKMSGLALWVPLATLEFAILDMLGRISGKSMGELIGEVQNKKIAIYEASGDRGHTAEETIESIKRLREEGGMDAKAIKFKVGGRMSGNNELPVGRSEKLIPLVRKTFGDDMTIYADSNGSYTADEAIRIGKIMEEFKLDFFEEPVPYDWYEETKEVADALTGIPIAGGEQEPSLHNFRWLIANDALDIVQPDNFYFGGMIRSMRVARMANAFSKKCVPHISGEGLGYIYMLHFVSSIPNAGPYHEFKGFNKKIPFECKTSSLSSDGGVITVPTGPGSGVDIDPGYIAKYSIVKL